MENYEVVGRDITSTRRRIEITIGPCSYYQSPEKQLREAATRNGLRRDQPLEINELSQVLNHRVK